MGRHVTASDCCLLLSIATHLWLCPFTKVEESFNMQAMHDILEHGSDLRAYDHNLFPGVVPRTFVGALLVSAAAFPFHEILRRLESAFPALDTLFLSQYICRCVLGLFAWMAYREFRKSIDAKFGTRAGAFFGALLSVQFHFPFYCSRSLPNTFALILTMVGYSLWLDGRASKALYVVASSMVIFRCDMVLLLGTMALQMLWLRQINFIPIVLSGIAVSLFALSITVVIDSYFWGRWLYPEGSVLFFNTVENKSSEWGTSPWHW